MILFVHGGLNWSIHTIHYNAGGGGCKNTILTHLLFNGFNLGLQEKWHAVSEEQHAWNWWKMRLRRATYLILKLGPCTCGPVFQTMYCKWQHQRIRIQPLHFCIFWILEVDLTPNSSLMRKWDGLNKSHKRLTQVQGNHILIIFFQLFFLPHFHWQ